MINSSPSYSVSEYEMSLPKASATLAGKVHGVVVQIGIKILSNLNFT
jgi:hypothetical protein